MSKVSVVLPSYNEGKMIKKAFEEISKTLSSHNIDYEIVYVDDGSSDETWDEIKALARDNSKVVGLHFSRNFGKESAIFAGLEKVTGDCAVVMDCDLQHPPKTIIDMYKLWQEGYEVVEGVKHSRGRESIFHKCSARMFYRLISSAVKIDMSRASDFKLMDKAVVDEIIQLKEKNSFFRALSSWVGFKTTQVEFDVQPRTEGESKWSTSSLIKYAVTNITSFSTAPLQVVTFTGILFMIIAVILAVDTLINYFSGAAIEGFTTVILLLLIIGSMLMLSLGIIGHYVAKIYEEVKDRPRYIVSETVNTK